VVPGPDADALGAEDLGDVVRVHTLERERDERAAVVPARRAAKMDVLAAVSYA
jgi:hypothetical protein